MQLSRAIALIAVVLIVVLELETSVSARLQELR